MGVEDHVFDEAYAYACARYNGKDWAGLEPKLRTRAIYEEMKRIDLERTLRPDYSDPQNTSRTDRPLRREAGG